MSAAHSTLRFVLEIDCDNSAFDDDVPELEISRILSRLAEHIGAFGADDGKVRDLNGNTVGSYRLVRS